MGTTLQGLLDASRRGSERGIQRVGQLQQLFAQKDKMERQDKQDKFEQFKFQLDNIKTGLASGVESWQKQAAIQLREFTSTNEGRAAFGYTVDIVDKIGKGDEKLDLILKRAKIQPRYKKVKKK